MKFFRTILLLLAGSSLFAGCERDTWAPGSVCHPFVAKRNFVSIAQLTSLPDCFRSRQSIVQGVLVYNDQFSYLYEDEQSAKYKDQAKQLALLLPNDNIREQASLAHMKRVRVVGELVFWHQFEIMEDIIVFDEK